MSSVENTFNTDNQQFTNYSTAKMFLGQNEYQAGEYNNDTYDDVTLSMGTLMGRVAATGLLVPLESGASDGSQYPVGILMSDRTILAGETGTVNVCVKGDVDQGMIVFSGSDDLDTVVDGRQLRDRIAGDTVGIVLVVVDELSDYDNQ